MPDEALEHFRAGAERGKEAAGRVAASASRRFKQAEPELDEQFER